MPANVSIIIPAKNSEKYLGKCIESVLAQKYTDWELLVVNDHSSDGTVSIAKSYAENDERIRILECAKSGVSCARNTGLENALGNYICFLDSDDRMSQDYLLFMTRLAEETSADIIQCSFYYEYENGKLLTNKEAVSAEYSGHESIMNAYFSGMIGKINLASWGKLYRSGLLDGIRFDEGLTVQEDAFFTFRCCMKAEKVVCAKEPFYYYYQNPDSVMNRPFDGSKMQYFTVLEREADELTVDKNIRILILKRKLITSLDLTGEIIRTSSGFDHLQRLRDISLDTYDVIRKFEKDEGVSVAGIKTRFKVFVLRKKPGAYRKILERLYKVRKTG